MLKNQVFIISWAGQHENACFIAKELKSLAIDIYIIYSDPDPNFELTANVSIIRRDDKLYAGDKIQACIDAFSGEHLFIICADCTCDDWAAAIKNGVMTFENHNEIWIWAPNINYSGYDLERTEIMSLPSIDMIAVAHTDTIVFGWKSPVVERIKKSRLKENIYGWGIGWMAVAFTYSHRKWVVVEPRIKVSHPKSRGYESHAASLQRDRFLMQLDLNEKLMCNLLSSKMMLHDFYKNRKNHKS
jgi:hypothetical protein